MDPEPDDDMRFTYGLLSDVVSVLEKHGYRRPTSGPDLVALQLSMVSHPNDNHDFTAEQADTDAEVFDLHTARTRRTGPAVADPNGDEIEPDDTDTDGGPIEPVMVDSIDAQRRPRFTLTGFRDAQRVPIVPTWLRSSREFGGNLAWATGFGLHALAYHGLRTPKYGVKLALRAPRGLGRVCRSYNRWWWDLEGEPVRQSVVRAAIDHPEEAKMYDRLTNKRDRRVRWRSIVTLALAVGLLGGAGAVMLAPNATQYTALAGLLVLLGIVGAPADKPLLGAPARRGRSPDTCGPEVAGHRMGLDDLRVLRATRGEVLDRLRGEPGPPAAQTVCRGGGPDRANPAPADRAAERAHQRLRNGRRRPAVRGGAEQDRAAGRHDQPGVAVDPRGRPHPRGGGYPAGGSPYDLRHAAVSTWLNGGVPPTDVAEWAGHSMEILLKTYAKCLDGGRAALLKRVEQALGY
jgi:hypothetical protein